MKPAPFAFTFATNAAAASAVLVQAGAKPIAGGQSLGPMLNLRLARPQLLIDVSRATELRGAHDEGDTILYGAAVTHAEIEDGAVPDATPGWLAAVARRIAYRAVRNRGTIGGSLAHADPAADWVNVLTALGAEVVTRSGSSDRVVPIERFFTGPFATVLQHGEIISAVRIRKRLASAQWGYWKFCLKAGDFAKASAAVLIDAARGEHRVLIGAIERPPVLLSDPQAFIHGRLGAAEAVRQAAPHLDGTAHALHIAALERALAQAAGDAP